MSNESVNLKRLIESLSLDFENLKSREIDNNSNLNSLLDWSSLNALILTARVKQDFKVELLPGELRATETFGQLLNLINAKRSG